MTMGTALIKVLHYYDERPRKGRPAILMSHPFALYGFFRAVSLIPLFYIFSLVILPSLVALSVLSFSAFGPFS